MANPYAILGLTADTDDAAVRARYLQLTREFPPEQHPEKSAAIREAYERLKDLDARAEDRLFGGEQDETLDAMLDELRSARPNRRITLNELFRMAGVSGR
jgi:curved DNA-binding protein CbpA